MLDISSQKSEFWKTCIHPHEQYLKDFSGEMRLVTILTNVNFFLILYNGMSYHLEDLHNSINIIEMTNACFKKNIIHG